MSQSNPRKRDSREFKLEAVKMVTTGGYSVPQIAGELGISQKSLYELVAEIWAVYQVRCSP